MLCCWSAHLVSLIPCFFTPSDVAVGLSNTSFFCMTSFPIILWLWFNCVAVFFVVPFHYYYVPQCWPGISVPALIPTLHGRFLLYIVVCRPANIAKFPHCSQMDLRKVWIDWCPSCPTVVVHTIVLILVFLVFLFLTIGQFSTVFNICNIGDKYILLT